MYHEVGPRAVIILLQFLSPAMAAATDPKMMRAKRNAQATFPDMAKSSCFQCCCTEYPAAHVQSRCVLVAHIGLVF